VCVHDTESMLHGFLINRSWEFRHIYNFGAVRDKDEQIRFRGRQVKELHHESKKVPL